MITNMKRFATLLLLVAFLLPGAALADEITVRPFLIDLTMVPRESATETIRLDSSYPVRKAIVFATVNEITLGPEGDINEFISPVMTDRSNTITSWIELQRGRIEIEPGGSTEIPLTVKVHPFAEPGEYHAFIGFVEASKRYIAEDTALAGDADGVVLKITIDDERVDTMRVSSLQVDRFVTNTDTQRVQVTVDNSGEIASAPTGELIFYDSRGREIAASDVNTAGQVIEPGGQRTFTVPVPLQNGIGRFKANLNIRYGGTQTANLYDTTSFFMIPLWYIVVLLAGVVLLVLIFTILLRRATTAAMPSEHGDEVALYVRDGHEPNPKDHDIDLTT